MNIYKKIPEITGDFCGANDGTRTRDLCLTKEYNKTKSPVLIHKKYIKKPHF